MSVISPFLYDRPQSLVELKKLLEKNEDVQPSYLAGGTDLWVNLHSGKKNYAWIIDLKEIKDLTGIEKLSAQNTLKIGALTSIHALEKEDLALPYTKVLSEAAANLGSYQIRNRATIGGNLCNGAPTADIAIALLALGATVNVWSPQCLRHFVIDDFWLGAGKTCLENQEIMTSVEVPILNGYTSAFLKQGPRKAMDIAIVSVACVLKQELGKVVDVRISIGGAGPIPLRASAAEQFLIGNKANKAMFQEAALIAARESNPRSSARASKEYRLELIPVMLERALEIALNRSKTSI